MGAFNMDAFEKKTLKTSRGFTYTYYVAEGDKSLPALFFQHGWPDHATMWQKIAEPLRSTKHPIIIPDLLGYDGTDKPSDPKQYKWDVMIPDLVEIIDAEGHAKVVSIGHDWGSACASHLYAYFPDRVVGLVNINVPYKPPTRQPMDLDAYNKYATEVFGAPLLSYWSVFAAPDGPELLKNNLDRIYHAMHGTVDAMSIFTSPNGMRDYLTKGDSDVKITLRPYAQEPEFKAAFMERFERDGFEGAQCWYRAAKDNYHYEADKNLPEDRDKVNVPVLFIGATEDTVCRPEALIPSINKGFLPNLEQAEMIVAGHWTPYETPQEVVDRLEPWLKKNFQ